MIAYLLLQLFTCSGGRLIKGPTHLLVLRLYFTGLPRNRILLDRVVLKASFLHRSSSSRLGEENTRAINRRRYDRTERSTPGAGLFMWKK
jgi:hypothetical protein